METLFLLFHSLPKMCILISLSYNDYSFLQILILLICFSSHKKVINSRITELY